MPMLKHIFLNKFLICSRVFILFFFIVYLFYYHYYFLNILPSCKFLYIFSLLDIIIIITFIII